MPSRLASSRSTRRLRTCESRRAGSSGSIRKARKRQSRGSARLSRLRVSRSHSARRSSWWRASLVSRVGPQWSQHSPPGSPAAFFVTETAFGSTECHGCDGARALSRHTSARSRPRCGEAVAQPTSRGSWGTRHSVSAYAGRPATVVRRGAAPGLPASGQTRLRRSTWRPATSSSGARRRGAPSTTQARSRHAWWSTSTAVGRFSVWRANGHGGGVWLRERWRPHSAL
jgi:hypothetical protein